MSKFIGVEALKFGVYLSVPVMAYMFFANRDRVKAMIAAVRINTEYQNDFTPHRQRQTKFLFFFNFFCVLQRGFSLITGNPNVIQ
jgi:hypothetical protein